jgi:hypothetical protein
MSDLEISSSPESYPPRCYTPIDELGDDAMCDNYIVYDEHSIPVKLTIDEAIKIIIDHKNHMYLTYRNMWNVRHHPLVTYLLRNDPELFKELNIIIDKMDPNPCDEFIKENEKKEQEEKLQKQQEFALEVALSKRRKEQMGERFNELLELEYKSNTLRTDSSYNITDIYSSLVVSGDGIKLLPPQDINEKLLEFNKSKSRYEELKKEYDSIV